MSDTNSNRPISIEAVAGKLAAARNFEHAEVTEQLGAQPRFVEVLLYLQFVSQPGNYAGGLRKFTADLIADSADLIGTAEMRRLPRGKFTASQAREIYEALPIGVRGAFTGFDEGADLLACIASPRAPETPSGDWSSFADEEALELLDRALAVRTAKRQRGAALREQQKAVTESMLKNATLATFHAICTKAAADHLSGYFRNLCEQAHVRFTREESSAEWKGGEQAPWYFGEVASAVLRWMSRRSTAIAATIAETEVTRLVFKWLGKARSTSRAVMISGNSRFGKTEALRTWCAMNPGLARLVNTPASNSEGELLREVAKALGLEIGPSFNAARLRDRIDYVLQHSRLMLCFDESHLIFPLNFTRNSAPARLNWVRRSVMDAGLPCVFVSTPQSYNSAQKRFVKTTGYAIEQFTGRLLMTVELPEELSREDLLAVARIHFPKLPEPYLFHVVEKTFTRERNYVSDLEKIATLAHDSAQECGRPRPTIDDIKSAIAYVLPATPRGLILSAPDEASAGPTNPALTAGGRPLAEAVPNDCKSPARGLRQSAEPQLAGAGGRLTFGAENPADLAHADGD